MTPPRSGAIAALLLFLFGAVPALSRAADDYQEASRLFKDGQRAEALDRVDAFLGQHPRDARARFLKGVILSEQSRTQDAIKVFTDLTQDYPELPEPYNNLAVLYAQRGELDRARALLEEALRRDPGYATAQQNLGDVLLRQAQRAYEAAASAPRAPPSLLRKLQLLRTIDTSTPAAAR